MSGRRYRSVASALRPLIVERRWEVGERLPAERSLSEEPGVPRATVREALIVLEVEGLVEARDPESARAATWRHLGNVSRTLRVVSDPEGPMASSPHLRRPARVQ